MVNSEQQVDLQSHPSVACKLMRAIKHGCYMPWRSKVLFDAQRLQRVTDMVQRAEQGHQGEIKVVIEGSLSMLSAYGMSNRRRAEQLFASLMVWDTEFNSGILLYLNLCDHSIDIVADRGICRYVSAQTWQLICSDIASNIQVNGFEAGLAVGITQIGDTLSQFYAQAGVDVSNELSNAAVLLP